MTRTRFILNSGLKFVFAALLAFSFFAAHPANVSAKTPKYGFIKILTNPGGLLLTIDGK